MKCPSLPTSVGFLIGCLAAFGNTVALLSLPLLYPALGWKRSGIAAFFALLGFGYSHLSTELPQKEQDGYGHFSLTSMETLEGKFHKTEVVLRGKFLTFFSGGERTVRNFPATVRLSIDELPPGDTDYWVKGALVLGELGGYYFQKDKEVPLLPVQGTFSLARIRYQSKEWVKKRVHDRITSKRGANFLLAMFTGTKEDPFLSEELGRFGLQHLVAISGFHFAAVAALATLCFKKTFGPFSIVILLSLYYLFVGPSPAVARSWGMALLGLLALMTGREKNSLHFLGIMLIAILLDEPYAAANLGFQFSFMITGAILVLSKPCEELLHSVFPLRSASDLYAMGRGDKYLYTVCLVAKKALSLSLAVHLAGVPFLLTLNGEFPVLSLYFNLFYPFLVSISLFLLLVALSLGWVPFLGNFLFSVLDWYTDTILSLLYDFPKGFDPNFYFNLPGFLFAIYLPLLFISPILTKNRKSNKVMDFYGECSSVG